MGAVGPLVTGAGPPCFRKSVSPSTSFDVNTGSASKLSAPAAKQIRFLRIIALSQSQPARLRQQIPSTIVVGAETQAFCGSSMSWGPKHSLAGPGRARLLCLKEDGGNYFKCTRSCQSRCRDVSGLGAAPATAGTQLDSIFAKVGLVELEVQSTTAYLRIFSGMRKRWGLMHLLLQFAIRLQHSDRSFG